MTNQTQTQGLIGRELEAMLIDRCVSVAHAGSTEAQDARDANVFRVAALIFNYKFKPESARLLQASERYFAQHPGTKVETGAVVTKGWILGFPRFRDRMERQLSPRK